MAQLLCIALLATSALGKPTKLFKRATPQIGQNTFTSTQLDHQIPDAFKDSVTLAKAGLDAASADNAIYQKYFEPDDLDTVQYVLNRIYGGGNGGDTLAGITYRSDFDDANGDRSCTEPRFFAATRDDQNNDIADTILCDPAFTHGGINKGYDTLDPPGPKAVTCDSIGDTVSWRMSTLGATSLHEATHYSVLTSPNLLDGTFDTLEGVEYYGATDCRIAHLYGASWATLLADVYAWYCTEAFWTAECKKDFGDPTADDDNDPGCDDQACAEPKGKDPDKKTTCDCNEDGCTDDSPPCCGNGTCPKPPSSKKRDLAAIMEGTN